MTLEKFQILETNEIICSYFPFNSHILLGNGIEVRADWPRPLVFTGHNIYVDRYTSERIIYNSFPFKGLMSIYDLRIL